MKSRNHGLLRALVVTIVVFALLFSGAIMLLEYIGGVSDEAQIVIVRDAVRNAIATCYAVEGSYPDSLEYLKANYGLSYDEERFFISYDAFASNVYPDILVSVKGENNI